MAIAQLQLLAEMFDETGIYHSGKTRAGHSAAGNTVDVRQRLRELQLHRAELDKCKRELEKARQELDEMRAHDRDLHDHAPVGYLTLDEDGCTVEINPAGASLLGRERESIIGKNFVTWLAKDEKSLFRDHLREVFRSRDKSVVELRIKTPGGILRDLHLESRLMDKPQQPLYCHSVLTDQSDRIKAEEASWLTACVIGNAAEGIMITDAHRIIRAVNPAFEKSTGYSASEAIGHTPALLKSGRHDKDFYKEIWSAINTFGKWQGEVWNRNKSGEIYPEWLSINAVRNHQGKVTHYVGIFSDVHTQENILERLRYLAYYDGLTGLPNRRLFLDRLSISIAQARREGHMLALMFIDLDNFKQINDSLGHRIGDSLLVAVTERMKICLRDCDTLARLGGDEFTVILPNLSQSDATTHVAIKFLESLASPVLVEEHELHVSASIGISIFPEDGDDAESLLNHADIAMYQVKKSGRNGYLHYDKTMGNSSRHQSVDEPKNGSRPQIASPG